MGDNFEEKSFKEKLKDMGITNPKIVRRPSGLYIAYPQPGSSETWKASYYKDDEESYHFEYTNDVKPKKY